MEGVPKFKSRSCDPSWHLLTHFLFLSLVLRVMNLHAKFDVSSSNRSRDMERVPKFRNRSRDLFPTCQWGVANDRIFEFPDPDLLIQYTTFIGLRWRLRVVYRRASPLLRPFWREIVPSKIGQNLRFRGKMGSKCKILFRDPQKAHLCAKPRHLAYWSWISVQGSRL